ncbi:phosphate-starvation-inducible PsiE family protein [Sulfurihydrogenibium sp.]|jgi:uncharacterized membrane protein (DUF373 family)|uniref:phosphate-starvation-inducible PsiE family protein n=1 Tax=Sulfurihydrogenibium sp. TaxID=2053621 RepID=UPI0026225CE0|nr:phosphate-starvation-inducible PsiE family protein [Sulfurihydrogenibium sp.]
MENILKFRLLDNSILFSLFVLELILSVGLFLNLIKIFYDIYSSYPNINEIIKHLINNALSMFILIEIIKSINDYIYYKRIRISVVLDVSIIILLRELVLGLYQHTISESFAIMITGIIFIMIIARAITIKFSPNNYNKAGV